MKSRNSAAIALSASANGEALAAGAPESTFSSTPVRDSAICSPMRVSFLAVENFHRVVLVLEPAGHVARRHRRWRLGVRPCGRGGVGDVDDSKVQFHQFCLKNESRYR